MFSIKDMQALTGLLKATDNDGPHATKGATDDLPTGAEESQFTGYSGDDNVRLRNKAKAGVCGVIGHALMLW